jgi:hypothetical protein
MVRDKNVELIWTMVRTDIDRKLVAWNTVVIVNPLFSLTSDHSETKILGKLFNMDLMKPLSDEITLPIPST